MHSSITIKRFSGIYFIIGFSTEQPWTEYSEKILLLYRVMNQCPENNCELKEEGPFCATFLLWDIPQFEVDESFHSVLAVM